jgi:Na+-translocating ferredoxin:NAD+ oxidoreductase RnfG subunit
VGFPLKGSTIYYRIPVLTLVHLPYDPTPVRHILGPKEVRMRKIIDCALRLLIAILTSVFFTGNITPSEATAAALQEDQETSMTALLKKALPGAERFERVDKGGLRYEVGYQGQERVGGVFFTDGMGYRTLMRVMVGIDQQGRVVEVLLLSHNETPAIWTKDVDQQFRAQFRAKSGPFILKKDNPSGNLDGVASATISCRAIIGAVEEAMRIFKREWGDK